MSKDEFVWDPDQLGDGDGTPKIYYKIDQTDKDNTQK